MASSLPVCLPTSSFGVFPNLEAHEQRRLHPLASIPSPSSVSLLVLTGSFTAVAESKSESLPIPCLCPRPCFVPSDFSFNSQPGASRGDWMLPGSPTASYLSPRWAPDSLLSFYLQHLLFQPRSQLIPSPQLQLEDLTQKRELSPAHTGAPAEGGWWCLVLGGSSFCCQMLPRSYTPALILFYSKD